MKISEMITDRYKLRIPPTVYYDLLADVQEAEEEQEPTTKNDLGVDCISRQDVLSEIIRFSTEEGASVECQQLYCDVNNMPSVTPPLCADCNFKMDEVRRAYDKVVTEGHVLDKLRAEINTLQNRCYALTKGVMCIYCKYECEYKAESEEA